ncbi:hypothetical protein [Reyranella sp.]|uniref:hypothetical protein n=1 Tax=Reyranella sp. TaxID=1929291 RepID=UPI003C7A75D8
MSGDRTAPTDPLVLATLRYSAGSGWDAEQAHAITRLLERIEGAGVVRTAGHVELSPTAALPRRGAAFGPVPSWTETSVSLPDRNAMPELPCGVLAEIYAPEPGFNVVAATLAFTFKKLVSVMPGRAILDLAAYNGLREVGFADQLRRRCGFATAAELPAEQLLEMASHVTVLEGRYYVRVLPGPYSMPVLQNFDSHPITPRGDLVDLRAMLACTAVEAIGLALTDAVPLPARDFASKLLNYNISLGSFVALLALSAGPLQQTS